MMLSAEIARYKQQRGLPVSDAVREAEKLLGVASRAPAELADYDDALFRALMELSKAYQQKLREDEA